MPNTKSLTVEQAGIIARANSNLSLDGVASISDEVAKALAQHVGLQLELNDLTALSDESAKALGEHKGDSLSLNGLTALSEEAAKALARHKGRLSLEGLTMLSDEAAKALATRSFTKLNAYGMQKVRDARQLIEESERHATRLAAEQRRQVFLPNWPDYEDLNLLLEAFGSNNHAASLEQFVRFGTPALAEKAGKGDRFDREEAMEAATAHSKGLNQRKFMWQAKYNWDERQPLAGKEGTVRLRVPVGWRCLAPADDAHIGVAAYSEHPMWFLTKEGTLKRCVSTFQVAQVVEANGVLYVPELLSKSELVLWVDGQREVQKAIAREPGQHVVNIGLAQLGMTRPLTKGFYRLDAIRDSDYTSGSLLIAFENGLNGSEDQPNYFVTQTRDPADERSMPEVVSARIERLEVVNVAGKDRRVVFSWSRE